MKKDTRFWLTTFFEEQEQTKHEYKVFKREIENNGCVKVKTETDTVKIYTPELAVIFTSNTLSARNMDTQTETIINGSDYLKTYIEAYKEGEQYFETEFKVSTNTLYGANAEQYVRDIHLNFFHVQHTGTNEGWSYVKKQYPMILTHKAVKEFGYYSGIVNKVEEQVKKYPRLFATFDKCEHNLPPQPIAKQNNKLSDLITHQKSIEIIDAIKIQYKNIKGKQLKLLLVALQALKLLPKERIAKAFHNCCKREFGWDVASYTAMNDYQFNEYTDKIELDNMKKFLEEIIQTK
jgi:hypothetical protein